MSGAERRAVVASPSELRSEAERARRLAARVGSAKIADGLCQLAEQLESEAADAERSETCASRHGSVSDA